MHSDSSPVGLQLSATSVIDCNVPSFGGVASFRFTTLTQIPASPLTDWMSKVSFFSFGVT